MQHCYRSIVFYLNCADISNFNPRESLWYSLLLYINTHFKYFNSALLELSGLDEIIARIISRENSKECRLNIKISLHQIESQSVEGEHIREYIKLLFLRWANLAAAGLTINSILFLNSLQIYDCFTWPRNDLTQTRYYTVTYCMAWPCRDLFGSCDLFSSLSIDLCEHPSRGWLCEDMFKLCTSALSVVV